MLFLSLQISSYRLLVYLKCLELTNRNLSNRDLFTMCLIAGSFSAAVLLAKISDSK